MDKYWLFGFIVFNVFIISCIDKSDILSLEYKKIAQCLEFNNNNLKRLLSEDMISQVFLNSENADVDESYGMILEYGYLEYSWINNRKKSIKLLDKQVMITQNDLISISGIRKTNHFDFLDRYSFVENRDRDFSFKRIDAVGEVSIWNTKENKLYVYLGELQFIIRVDVANENEINENKSIEIANMIIENCLEK